MKRPSPIILQAVHAEKPLEREQLAGALAAKASLLCELGRRTEAIAAFTQLIDRFEGDEIQVIAHVVAMAREARAHLLEDE